MLNKGFTLAEVLVTLGIIGVVAALTTPALIQNIGNAKIGPTLSKAVSTFAIANENLLAAEEANSITGVTLDQDEYVKKLSEHMKLTEIIDKESIPEYKYYNGQADYKPFDMTHIDQGALSKAFISDDNILFYITYGAKQAVNDAYADIPSNQKIGEVLIDINGTATPNAQAKDIFRFYLYNDGTLRPYGGLGFDKTSAPHSEALWKNTTHGCNENKIGEHAAADTCTGSIFDNNMKVIYK